MGGLETLQRSELPWNICQQEWLQESLQMWRPDLQRTCRKGPQPVQPDLSCATCSFRGQRIAPGVKVGSLQVFSFKQVSTKKDQEWFVCVRMRSKPCNYSCSHCAQVSTRLHFLKLGSYKCLLMSTPSPSVSLCGCQGTDTCLPV